MDGHGHGGVGHLHYWPGHEHFRDRDHVHVPEQGSEQDPGARDGQPAGRSHLIGEVVESLGGDLLDLNKDKFSNSTNLLFNTNIK